MFGRIRLNLVSLNILVHIIKSSNKSLERKCSTIRISSVKRKMNEVPIKFLVFLSLCFYLIYHSALANAEKKQTNRRFSLFM